jgi:Bacteriophage replication protein O
MSNPPHHQFAGFRSPNYTQVPDDLFDDLLPDLSGAELKVLLYIMRRTFGFKKASDRISKAQLERGIQRSDGTILDRGTGLSRRAIRLAVDSLVERCILLKFTYESRERGHEPTEYALHVLTPDVHPWVLSTQAKGNKVPKGLGRAVPPQETVLQETVRQDQNLSNVRKVSTSQITQEEPNETITLKEPSDSNLPSADSTPSDSPSHHRGSTPAGFSSVGDVLLTRRNGKVPFSHPQKAYSEERQQILSYMEDFAREFGDEAPLASSVTRAYNIWQQSGIPIEAFCTLLYEARSRTWSVTANIKKTKQLVEGEKSPWGPSKNRMAYFFSVLEETVMKHAPAAGADSHTVPDEYPANDVAKRQTPVDLSPKDDRQTIRGYVERYAKLFGDEAPIRSSVSRAYNLYERSGVSMARFIAYLFEAQSLTQEYSANVTKRQGKAGPFGPEKNRMAYFFSILVSKLQLTEGPPHATA